MTIKQCNMLSVSLDCIFATGGLTLANTSLCHSCPPEVVQQVAEYFSLLGEPTRLQLLNQLSGGEKCVQELMQGMQTSQANVSKHLKVMWQAGILSRRSERKVFRIRVPRRRKLFKTRE